jgi:hypothetical protein
VKQLRKNNLGKKSLSQLNKFKNCYAVFVCQQITSSKPVTIIRLSSLNCINKSCEQEQSAITKTLKKLKIFLFPLANSPILILH